jgi:hypothetical protein
MRTGIERINFNPLKNHVIIDIGLVWALKFLKNQLYLNFYEYEFNPK